MQTVRSIALALLLAITGEITTSLPGSTQTSPVQKDTPQFDCLSQYPQSPVPNDRAMSRNEFAVGLNNCLDEIKQRLNLEGYATKTDLETLTQRQQELNQELQQLKNRVDTTIESN